MDLVGVLVGLGKGYTIVELDVRKVLFGLGSYSFLASWGMGQM